MITNYLYLYKHVLNDMGIFFQKRKEKPKHLKFAYLSNYLNKMKQKIKQIEDAIYYIRKVIK
jgi:hypothetical protein